MKKLLIGCSILAIGYSCLCLAHEPGEEDKDISSAIATGTCGETSSIQLGKVGEETPPVMPFDCDSLKLIQDSKTNRLLIVFNPPGSSKKTPSILIEGVAQDIHDMSVTNMFLSPQIMGIAKTESKCESTVDNNAEITEIDCHAILKNTSGYGGIVIIHFKRIKQEDI